MNDDAKLCFIGMMPLQCLRELKIMIQEILLRRRNNGKDKSATNSNFFLSPSKQQLTKKAPNLCLEQVGTRNTKLGREQIQPGGVI